MSLAHYISLQNKDPGFDYMVNGKAMAHASDELEAIAKSVGVTPIMDFYGRKWHAAESGLETVRALLSYVAENPKSLAKTEFGTEAVVEDLKEWEEVLLKAQSVGTKWKMSIDY